MDSTIHANGDNDVSWTPHNYQVTAMNFLLENDRAALFLDMGMGKTATLLAVIWTKIFHEQSIRRVLIVAPPQVARTTWTNEAKKWAQFKDLTVVSVDGNIKKRREALRKEAHIYTLSSSSFVWLVKTLGTGIGQFDMFVIDESSQFKNPTANKSIVMAQAKYYVKHMYLLSGTPSPNGLLDIWQQINLVDERVLPRTFAQYKNSYFEADEYAAYTWNIKDGAKEEITERIAPVTMYMEAKDYPELALKDMVNVRVEIPFSDKLMKQYKQFERDSYLAFESEEARLIQVYSNDVPTLIEVVAANKGALYNKLLQFTSGKIYDAEKMEHTIHTLKMDRLAEMISDFGGHQAFIVYGYQSERDALKNYVKDLTLYRPGAAGAAIIENWTKRKITNLAAHPASIGHGTNLQDSGANRLIWLTPTWNLEHRLQTDKRLHRQGQKNTVYAYDLIVPGTIDDYVLDAQRRKTKSQDYLLQRIKRSVEGK